MRFSNNGEKGCVVVVTLIPEVISKIKLTNTLLVHMLFYILNC